MSEIIDKFKIGYAPGFGLKEYLNSFGIEDKILIDVGLINKSCHDYFCDRLIFPIHNIDGSVIGFGGRSLLNKQYPKYLNSPESQLFKKRENLYGLNLALDEIRRKQQVFVVEGYMDVIALHQAGISNTVALLGTSISSDQIKNLWKFAREILICMDGDSAGRSATIKVAEFTLSILEPGYTLKFINLPRDKDPYDICNELEYKKKDVLSVLYRSIELHSEYLWSYIVNSNLQKYEKLSPEKYSVFEYKFKKYVNTILNKSIRSYYRDYFYGKNTELRRTFKRQIFNSKIRVTKSSWYLCCSKSPKLIEAEQNQNIIIRIVIEFPEVLLHPIFFDQFFNFEFTNPKIKKLQQFIIDVANNSRKLNRETLLRKFDQSNSNIEIIRFIFEKTRVFNSQLNNRRSAETVWNNVILRKELNFLQKEKIKARLSGNFDLEERLIEQTRKIEERILEIQTDYIQNI